MPKENNFFHSKYSRSDPGDRATYLTFEAGPSPLSPPWTDSMAHIGEALSQSGVRCIVFVYGSHLKSDLFGSERLDEVGGLKRGYSRGIPGLESLLGILRPASYAPDYLDRLPEPPYHNDLQLQTQIDSLVGDTGNITQEYLTTFSKGLNKNLKNPILCQRYLWSSLHHHLGRVDAALQLFHYLRELQQHLPPLPENRILIVGHGQAGLVLSLLSNFLAPGESFARESILEIMKSYYDQQNGQKDGLSVLKELAHHLNTLDSQSSPILDIVTLGTPVRYGWDTDGVTRLLHIINHRPIRPDNKQWLAKMELPQIAWEIPAAVGGDYVQQLAVAGTDAVPHSQLERETNQALREHLEPYDGFERWLECARRVTRCPNDGQCLLIDYQDSSTAHPSQHLFGHACYTRQQVMLFQMQGITHAFYASSSQSLNMGL